MLHSPQADQILSETEMTLLAKSSPWTVPVFTGTTLGPVSNLICTIWGETQWQQLSGRTFLKTYSQVSKPWQVPLWLKGASNDRTCLKTLGSILFKFPSLGHLLLCKTANLKCGTQRGKNSTLLAFSSYLTRTAILPYLSSWVYAVFG